jgi:hypothetical protein
VPALELTNIVSALAAQAVNTQQIFDTAYKEELDNFALLVGKAGRAGRDIVQPLAPRRLLLREFQMALSLSFVAERDTELRLRAIPFNMNYSLRHSLQHDSGNRLAMCVEQVPLAPCVLPGPAGQKGGNSGQSK